MSTLPQEIQDLSYIEIADSLSDLHVDPFLHNGQDVNSPLEGAQFLCSYWLFAGVESVDEHAYLLRLEDQDELWVRNGLLGSGIAASSKTLKQYADIECALTLLTVRFMASLGHLGPEGCWRAGLVSVSRYDALVAAIKTYIKMASQAARAKDSAIVKGAAELGLNPEPTGHAANTFRARCPGAKHGLQIDADKELFYCGYGKHGGDVEALRAFVAKRQGA